MKLTLQNRYLTTGLTPHGYLGFSKRGDDRVYVSGSSGPRVLVYMLPGEPARMISSNRIPSSRLAVDADGGARVAFFRDAPPSSDGGVFITWGEL